MDQTTAVSQTASAPLAKQVASDVAPLGRAYASFLIRLGAALIDSVLVAVVSFTIAFVLYILGNAVSGGDASSPTVLALNGIVSLFNLVFGLGYYIYFTGKTGQTLGKRALKIKVVQVGSDAPLGYVNAFLREVVGKLLSSLVFGLGYLWVIWDKDKQGWHDKIAKTVVIKV